jgi:hypothetical protein
MSSLPPFLPSTGLYAGYGRYSTLSSTAELKKEEEEVQTGSNPLQNSVDLA